MWQLCPSIKWAKTWSVVRLMVGWIYKYLHFHINDTVAPTTIFLNKFIGIPDRLVSSYNQGSQSCLLCLICPDADTWVKRGDHNSDGYRGDGPPKLESCLVVEHGSLQLYDSNSNVVTLRWSRATKHINLFKRLEMDFWWPLVMERYLLYRQVHV